LAKGVGDEEALQWVLANAKTPRAPWEIEAWSAYMEKRSPDSDAETLSIDRHERRPLSGFAFSARKLLSLDSRAGFMARIRL
jgi:Domain of unknown function (DUF5069)